MPIKLGVVVVQASNMKLQNSISIFYIILRHMSSQRSHLHLHHLCFSEAMSCEQES